MEMPDDFKAHVALVISQHFGTVERQTTGFPGQYSERVQLAKKGAYGQLHRHIRRKKVDHAMRQAMRKYAEDATIKGYYSMFTLPVSANPHYKGMVGVPESEIK